LGSPVACDAGCNETLLAGISLARGLRYVTATVCWANASAQNAAARATIKAIVLSEYNPKTRQVRRVGAVSNGRRYGRNRTDRGVPASAGRLRSQGLLPSVLVPGSGRWAAFPLVMVMDPPVFMCHGGWAQPESSERALEASQLF